MVWVLSRTVNWSLLNVSQNVKVKSQGWNTCEVGGGGFPCGQSLPRSRPRREQSLTEEERGGKLPNQMSSQILIFGFICAYVEVTEKYSDVLGEKRNMERLVSSLMPILIAF